MKSFLILFVCSFFVSTSVMAEEMVYAAGRGEKVEPLSAEELKRLKEDRNKPETIESTGLDNKAMKVMSFSNSVKATSVQKEEEAIEGARGEVVR